MSYQLLLCIVKILSFLFLSTVYDCFGCTKVTNMHIQCTVCIAYILCLWRPEDDAGSLELEFEVVVNNHIGAGN